MFEFDELVVVDDFDEGCVFDVVWWCLVDG